jgi:tetratricopeptide (TPR) repeat protein
MIQHVILPLAARNLRSSVRSATLVFSFVLIGAFAGALAADVSEANRLYRSGKYVECVQLAGEAIDDGQVSETWRILRIQAELALGRYPDALDTLEVALKRFPASVRLRWIGHHVYLHNGKPDQAKSLLDEIDDLFRRASGRYRDPASHVTLGQFLLHRGVDPKMVLERVFDQVTRQYPNFADAYQASGELALEKHDYELAAEVFDKAAKLDPVNPDLCYGLARAYAPSDAPATQKWLDKTLQLNPNHVDSLLLIVDGHIDSERYEEAIQVLDRIERINPHHPLAWSYRAVLAHLANQPDEETQHRSRALASWPQNPQVDSLIGKKLSQKYRFADGAEYQQRALELDSDYLPARIQLSQDLLRLGQEKQGWELADEVYTKDAYNVVAHNLVTLHDNLSKYATLERDGFLLRMDPHEARIYGPQVLDLLCQAKQHLCPKYEVQIDGPIIVELFAKQQDFAIRTFGLPGGAGFLGVCFGHVITANSPASQGENPTNWQATLWHEFCHVVTLDKTNNKMPRWLSEGISVYEETKANHAWGQSMNPQYRQMILGDDLTPVSQLSGAFLNPASPQHLQFAYFESALVVEYLVDEYGLNTLKRILVDLGAGMPINESLQRYIGSLEVLDREFAEYARKRASELAPHADWKPFDLLPDVSSTLMAAWNDDHPNNIEGLKEYAKQLMAEKQWEAAKRPLEKLLELFPEDISPDNAYRLLASVHRELGETEREAQVLESLAQRDADTVDVYLRLMELASNAKDWPGTIANGERMLAVQPLQPAVYRYLAEAADATGDQRQAIQWYHSLLEMDPLDPAELHFRLARLLYRSGDLASARRHALQSLEEAPRFREAHRLLLQIVSSSAEADQSTAGPQEEQPEDEKEKPAEDEKL